MKPKELIMIWMVMSAIFLGVLHIYYQVFNPKSALAKIDSGFDDYDFLSLLDIPSEQKSDCMCWAIGENWFRIKWNYRAETFRDLHPELNAEDFADHTKMDVFWERVSKAYLETIN